MNRSFVAPACMILVSLSVACGYDNGDRVRTDTTDQLPVVSGAIETDATMENTESGIGVFVEYAAGGTWTLRVGCDTADSDLACLWDVVAFTPVGGHIFSSEAIDLEQDDLLTVRSDGELNLVTTTTSNLDGVTFTTDPGDPVTFDLVLEDEKYPEQFFYYVSDGVVVNDATSPIIELTPTQP